GQRQSPLSGYRGNRMLRKHIAQVTAGTEGPPKNEKPRTRRGVTDGRRITQDLSLRRRTPARPTRPVPSNPSVPGSGTELTSMLVFPPAMRTPGAPTIIAPKRAFPVLIVNCVEKPTTTPLLVIPFIAPDSMYLCVPLANLHIVHVTGPLNTP